jgi:hypothetical protein
LDIRSISHINNDILETSLLMDRKIHILCEDTKVNPVEFCYKYEKCTKELTERNYYKFSYKNLTFESSMPKKIESGGGLAWQDGDGKIYFLDEDGLIEDEDEDEPNNYSDFFDEDQDEYLDGDDDYDDDMDFLDNDGETEMLNELDT